LRHASGPACLEARLSSASATINGWRGELHMCAVKQMEEKVDHSWHVLLAARSRRPGKAGPSGSGFPWVELDHRVGACAA